MPLHATRLLIAFCVLLLAGPAAAVLIASGDGTENVTAPPADPGWSNVGSLNGLSGVYLGDGWVLTANHVGIGPITLNGVSYAAAPESGIRLEHTPGVPTDLLMFRVIADPGLPSLAVPSVSPSLGNATTMIGIGCARGAPYTFTGHAGWRWVYTYAKRWGTNAVNQASADRTINGLPLRAFGMTFDDLGGTVPEAIVTTGDSGGAAFIDGALAGILVAKWSFGGQASSSSVFGNGSYAADLSHYRAQMIQVVTTVGACNDGEDDDGDGLVDLDDPGCLALDDPFETNSLVGCDDGFDNDADGLVDWPNDPGCELAVSATEHPACDDGIDNDGDGGIDWDGAGVGVADVQCLLKPWRKTEGTSSCGLGFEVVAIAPLVARLLRRRRA
jgi:hypothetical protein